MAKPFGGRPPGAHRFLLVRPEVAGGLKAGGVGRRRQEPEAPKGNRSPLSVLSAGGWRAYLFSYLRALLAFDPS
jgi:hypothetical protein